MLSNKILLILFVLVSVGQLYLTGQVIFQKEGVIEQGKEFRFKTAPVDPVDPFRGRYITLSFEAIAFKSKEKLSLEYDQKVYVLLEKDSLGFAKIKEIRADAPTDTQDYVQANVRTIYEEDEEMEIRVSYPFDRFFMDEFKAPEAEKAYFDAQWDEQQEAYASVYVLNGEAVLYDVVVNGKSVRRVLEGEK